MFTQGYHLPLWVLFVQPRNGNNTHMCPLAKTSLDPFENLTTLVSHTLVFRLHLFGYCILFVAYQNKGNH